MGCVRLLESGVAGVGWDVIPASGVRMLGLHPSLHINFRRHVARQRPTTRTLSQGVLC